MESNPARPAACLCPQTKNSSSPTSCRRSRSQSGFRPPASTRSTIRQSTSFAGSIQLLLVLGHSFVPCSYFVQAVPSGAHPRFPYYNTPLCLELPGTIRPLRRKIHWPLVQWTRGGVGFGDSIPFHSLL